MIAALRLWLRRHKPLVAQAAALSVAVLATFLATEATRYVGLLEQAERYISDWEIAALLPPAPQDRNVVIVKITEQTLQQFPYREPIDRAFLAHLVEAVAAGHPRAIGIDELFDDPTEPAKDAELQHALRALKVPLVVSYVDNPRIVPPERLAYLNAFVPRRDRAYATLGLDKLDVVRTIFPGAVAKDGKFLPGFAAALAAKLGKPKLTQPVTLVWHGQPSPSVQPFREVEADFAPIMAKIGWFRNAVVLIGEEVSLNDRHRTPFDRLHPMELAGVEIQAHAVSQLLEGRRSPAASALLNLLIVFLCAAMGAELGAFNLRVSARVGFGALFVMALWAGGAALYHYGGAQINLVAPSLAMALSLWATESLTGREARKERAFIHGAFSRYVAPKVVEQLMLNPESLALDGVRREMTFLFSDIEGFTSLSEKMESRELARVLNAYLDGATEEVLKAGGMVDKFIGDAVFAIFNAPVDLAQHELMAVRCAMAMDRFAQSFAAQQRADGIPFGKTRIGVHTGVAVVGNFGSRERFNYTAQGDAVNTASRLEGLNKHFGTRLCVSEAAMQHCPGIVFRPMADVVLKGKTEALAVFEPLQEGDPAHETLERYLAAYAAMKAGAPEAEALFAALVEETPDDPLAALHAARLARGERGTAIVMDEK